MNPPQLIFREFERLGNGSEAGVGLGLAIVERTAALLGLTVTLDSNMGKGSRFSLGVNLVKTRRPAAGLPQTVHRKSGPVDRILIVDDDDASRVGMQVFAESRGYKTVVFDNVASALACNEDFDSALIDYNFGTGMNGVELIQALRAGNPQARFALVTAAKGKEILVQANALDIAILIKPVATKALETWLARHKPLAAE